jgi:deazaflavin-dependent oxidoreductase (nitroreductase family)
MQRFAMAPRRTGSVTPMPGYRTQHEKSAMARLLQAVARSRVGGWLFINVFPVIDRWLIPVSRGRLKVAMGQPILLLHTRGARSGQPRSTPLLYTPHGEGFLVVASKAGAEHHPAWYHNLRAHPDDVTVEVGGRQIPVHPRVLEAAERDQLWRVVNDNYNGYDTYQGRAGARVIPVVLLER